MMVKRLEYHRQHRCCLGFGFSFGGTDWAQKARRRERTKAKAKERNYAENRKQSDWLAV